MFQSMIQNLINLSRKKKQLLMVFSDVFIIIFIIFMSLFLRYGFFFLPNIPLIIAFLFAPLIAIPIFIRFGLYREILRFIGFRSLWAIVQAVTLYALVFGVFIFLTDIENTPRSVVLINWLLSIISICSIRMIARWILTDDKNLLYKNVVIYGAGDAGRQLLLALKQSKEYNPVGLIDDSVQIQNQAVNGLRVSPPSDLNDLIINKNVSEILIAMPSISRLRREEIMNFLESKNVMVRSVPSISELAQGVIKIEDLRKVNIHDLLGREPVEPDSKLLKTKIIDKVVLVTGAGGSIGAELCRQILVLNPKKIILFDISESTLYQIEQELISENVFEIPIVPVLGSVRYYSKLLNIFEFYKVDTIYHAAAYKHVPLVELNPSEGILNNSIGTRNAAEAAIKAKVETFVLISTDKAVRPTNTMGAAKRVAELVVQALAQESHNTCFTMVRFGNVLDSSGSVIPLFKKQIKQGGPITVTDINVVRFFMTIPEAVELVIQAGAMAEGGDVFILDMGKPILINDLARKMISLSGLQVQDKNNPDGDIEIIYTGLRPGEKLFEELLVSAKSVKTSHPLIMRAEEEMINWAKLKPALAELEKASNSSDNKEARKLILKLVPEFLPKSF